MRLEEIVFVSPLGLRYLCLPKYISMKFTEQKLKGVFVIEPQVFGDSRGYFMESYKKELFEKYIGCRFYSRQRVAVELWRSEGAPFPKG